VLERDDRGVDGPGVEGDSRLGELLEVERDEGLRAAARVAVMRGVFGPRRLEPGCEELEGRDRVRSGAATRLDKHEDDLGLLDVTVERLELACPAGLACGWSSRPLPLQSAQLPPVTRAMWRNISYFILFCNAYIRVRHTRQATRHTH